MLDVRSADNDADRFAPLIVAFAHPDDEIFHGGVIYEYACHEGNRAMEGILAGARAEEAKAMKQNAHREN